ncbi:MAG: PRD domain-containing protein [Spirochaetaceae bacterium]|jgi:beta-glucoside operon transcriptional antiterminator|nr:PRD domain-containing protein [Spirochaetaceae bacterium]
MTGLRKCNNNIIFAKENGRQVIALGKGLGFNLKPGGEVDVNLVEKVFVPQETLQLNRFLDVLADLPYENVILADKIVDLGKERLGKALNQSIVIALADHLTVAINRHNEALELQMPLILDFKHIFPLEFAVGCEALDLIKAETGIEFNQSEAAAITLHFINAELDFGDMPNTVKMSNIIQKSVSVVESYYKTVFSEDAVDFTGFIALLRNIAIRFMNHKNETQGEDLVLYDLLRKRYNYAFTCAEKIAALMEKDAGWKITINDISFLTLYIDRITAKGKSG